MGIQENISCPCASISSAEVFKSAKTSEDFNGYPRIADQWSNLLHDLLALVLLLLCGQLIAGCEQFLHLRILGDQTRVCGLSIDVDLRLHDLLQEAGQPIEYCYFPNTAMASILNVMADGKSVEVGPAGWEGFVGLPVVAGFTSSASRVVTQAEGTALRIMADEMRNMVRKCPELTVSLYRYSQEATMEVTQIAACNRLEPKREPKLGVLRPMRHSVNMDPGIPMKGQNGLGSLICSPQEEPLVSNRL